MASKCFFQFSHPQKEHTKSIIHMTCSQTNKWSSNWPLLVETGEVHI